MEFLGTYIGFVVVGVTTGITNAFMELYSKTKE